MLGFSAALLACTAPAEPATAPVPEIIQPSEPACDPVALDELAEFAVAVVEATNWRYDPDQSRVDSSRLELVFTNNPLSAYVGVAVASSSEEIDVALSLPTGPLVADIVPLTAEQLTGVGERATGFTVTRVVYDDRPRGTRRREWTHSEISFARCRVVVRVGAERHAEFVIQIARELDAWLRAHTTH